MNNDNNGCHESVTPSQQGSAVFTLVLVALAALMLVAVIGGGK